jgi:hypothetical protein
MPQENPYIDRDDLLSLIRAEFVAHGNAQDPKQDYKAQRKALTDQLKGPGDIIAKRQHEGKAAACAYQILLELGWLAKYCTDWKTADDRMIALNEAMANIDKDEVKPSQSASDGSWGGCISEWYRKLEPTVDELQVLPDCKQVVPLSFMTCLLKPKHVLYRLWQLQISDIRTTGRNNRDELGAMQTALSQLIFKDNLRDLFKERPELCFDISQELEDVYCDFLSQTQHPRTGYWGPWYRIGKKGKEKLLQVQDLSFTFHIINYRQGNVENWPAIIDTTLDIETLVYPAGWTPSGVAKRSHHNNYDVATIFALGWPHMTDEQKVMVRERIRRLLAWCLGEIAEKHGFNDEPDTAAADTYYYGARFLDRLGFWDPQRRFWSRSAPDLPDWITSPGALAGLLLDKLTALNDHTAETATATAILQTAKYTQTNAPPPDDGA